MSFQDRIRRLPIPLDPVPGDEALDRLGIAPGPVAKLIRGAAGCSPYLAGLIGREGEWLLAQLSGACDLSALVARETQGFGDLATDRLGSALRQAKRRVALLTALGDIGGVWTLEEVTATLTALADRAVDLALRAHVGAEIARGKLPPTDADAGGIVALAMGKMGAAELNYSSDIDLIVLYDDSAFAPQDRHEARAALIRATRRMVATLSDNTPEGYVFRTDLRLRPDASVTPVCISTSAALAYYEAEGRTWERGAYIKARPCAGDIAAGARFLEELRPFVWRRHLDFATIEDTQDMRRRIRQHKGLQTRILAPGHDIKLGPGGIREIEFFTQTRQLISGGRDASLRDRDTVGGLHSLARQGWIDADTAQELTLHYRAHREVEHRIQMIHDAQTHTIPTGQDGIDAIARLMGHADSKEWAAEVEVRLARVEELTDDFFTPAQQVERPALPPEGEAIVARWPHYPALRSQRARQLFARIEADLLTRIQATASPGDALTHFDSFLAGLPAGVQILSLFQANPQLLDLLVDICGTSPWLARYLSRHSEVLDAVLGGGFFAPWPKVPGLADQLGRQLDRTMTAHDGGYERALDLVRRWVHEWQFRIGVHHLRGLIGSDEAGQQYADVADATLSVLFPLVAQEFARRHGPPPGRGAVLVGMGSLGARMLNSGSDLDLIVIYDSDGQDGSDGPRPLSTRPYYARLTQAMITALSAPTATGRAYEVDMRLRPSGRQGPVATSIQSFRDYQMTEAWTWEHLALTRSRVVAGCGADSSGLAAGFEALRTEILSARGQDARVLPDLAAMRARIFAAKPGEGKPGAKLGRGRLQDIELFAQSCALRAGSAARRVPLQLQAGQRAGLISAGDFALLSGACRLFWNVQCAGRLLSEEGVEPARLGSGARDFMLRETGTASVQDLTERLDQAAHQAGEVIEGLLAAQA